MIYLLPVLAVVLSYVFVIGFKPKKTIELRLLLSFSGSFLLALTIFELLPAVYENSNPKTVGVYIVIGILIQIVLEFFSKGAEHGHVHEDTERNHFPWVLFISLSLHALLEGLPIEKHTPLLYGILIHKIPIAVILSIFLLNSGIKLLHATFFMVLFSLMTPLGVLIAANIEFIAYYYVPITAIVVGVFLHVSTIILFESSEKHTFNLRKLSAIVLGMVIAYFI